MLSRYPYPICCKVDYKNVMNSHFFDGSKDGSYWVFYTCCQHRFELHLLSLRVVLVVVDGVVSWRGRPHRYSDVGLAHVKLAGGRRWCRWSARLRTAWPYRSGRRSTIGWRLKGNRRCRSVQPGSHRHGGHRLYPTV